jgi:hypothetical protein
MEATMSHHDPNGRRPPGPPDPLRASPPQRYEDDFDEKTWTYGVVVAAIIAAVAVIGAVIWVIRGDHQTAGRPQAQITETTGQSAAE